MAKQLKLSIAFPTVVFAMGFSVLAGCQQTATVVDALPAPNLNGPDIMRPTAPVAVIPPLAPLAPFASPIPSTFRGNLAGTPKDWIPVAAARPWRWIVIHHSDTPTGSAAAFDKMHREKGWDELGYHFVIGNGTQSGDGQVEVGPRWPIQKHGAHAKTPDNRYNDFGIGICLVGNFEVQRPTPAQLRSLAKLVAFLQETYNIPSSCILGHRDCKPTLCPGANVSIPLVRRMASQVLVDAGIALPKDTDVAGNTTATFEDVASAMLSSNGPTTAPSSGDDLLIDAPSPH